MSLEPGTRLGPHEIGVLIGAGGMGEVYRARDTSLDRDVAIKVLPEAFSADAERLARFEREARVLASLNHPNIAAIHGLERSGEAPALVLELVEGPTLADRIRRGAIPLDEALPIARQIAEALEAAHEQGIVHRDLKPANIKVTPDGVVKVLDFGLAKALEPERIEIDAANSPTRSMTAAATRAGLILGTAAYVSPEQARGHRVDRRTDAWAFGIVLYEMLTGRQPFAASDVSDTLAFVLTRDVDWSLLPPGTPASIRRLLRRCVTRERRNRLADMAVARLEIDEAQLAPEASDASGDGPAAGAAAWQRPVALAGVGVLGLVLGGLAVWSPERPEAPRVVKASLATGDAAPLFVSPNYRDIAISRDGMTVVYVGVTGDGEQGALYARAIDALHARPIVQDGQRIRCPFVSPDGECVGFFDFQSLKKVPRLGGAPITIAENVGFPRGASWGVDGTIVFASAAQPGLFRVSASGGEPERVTDPDAGAEHSWPEILPGGRAVLFMVRGFGDDLDVGAQVAVLDLETGEQRILVPRGGSPHFAATGHIVYGVAGTLFAVPFDVRRLEVTGDPAPVLEQVMTKVNGSSNVALASDGSLAYVAGNATGGSSLRLVWVDRDGREEPLTLPAGEYVRPRLAPDGGRLAVALRSREGTDVWVSDLTRGTLSKVTTDPAGDTNPSWTPDGDRVVFVSRRQDHLGFFWKPADGRGDAEPLATIETAQILGGSDTWARDGHTMVFFYQAADTGFDIGVLSPDDPRGWRPWLETRANESNPVVSPDGGWIAYASDETGRDEIYVERFPESGGREQISTTGGRDPTWSHDGRELFYRSLIPRAMMAVPIAREGSTLRPGRPEALFDDQYPSFNGRHYDVAPDGRFLMVSDDRENPERLGAAYITFVQHWFEELRARVPATP